jgi:nitrogen fixation protein FixH
LAWSRLGPEAGAKYDSADHRIVISLPRAQVQQIVKACIQLYRPSAAGLDRQFELKPGPDGVQRLDTAGLRSGPWKLRVLWTAAGEDYLIEQSLLLAGSTH